MPNRCDDAGFPWVEEAACYLLRVAATEFFTGCRRAVTALAAAVDGLDTAIFESFTNPIGFWK